MPIARHLLTLAIVLGWSTVIPTEAQEITSDPSFLLASQDLQEPFSLEPVHFDGGDGISESRPALLAGLFSPDRRRLLPFLGNGAREAGYDIPLPHGVGANIAYMDQGMDIEQISLEVAGGPAIPLNDIPPFRIKSRDTNISGRYDLWVLPFVNFYGIAGYTQGSAVGEVTVTGVPGLAPDTLIPIRIDYDGPTYGGGCTAAIGYKSLFAVVDWNYTETTLDGLDSSISAQTVAPRVGFQSAGKAIWVGAFYTSVDKQLSSSVTAGGVPVRFVIDLDVATPWNFIYGIRWAPTPNLEFVVEHGFSGRNQIIGVAAVRF